jgi:hypothetical protein
MKKLWLAPLALACGAAYASPDTLYMEDGRRIRGELISANRSVIVFNQDDGSFSRARRVRLNRADVLRIDLTDDYLGDDDATTPGSWNGTGRDIVIRADQAWTNTGIQLRAGDLFRVDADGFINWGPNRSDDPNGEPGSPYNANRPLPNRAGGALIGRIGNGEPFFIGSGMQSFRAGSTGTLYLGVNDDYLRDNSGSFRVMISPR